MFVVQGFPRVGFVEKKIEEVWIFSCNGALLRCRGVPGLALRCSEAAEESVNDGACVKQILQRAESSRVCAEKVSEAVLPRHKSVQSAGIIDLLPSGRIRTRSIGPCDVSIRRTFERPTFKWMASADNCDSLGKVLMMGSVSWLPSIGSTTTN